MSLKLKSPRSLQRYLYLGHRLPKLFVATLLMIVLTHHQSIGQTTEDKKNGFSVNPKAGVLTSIFGQKVMVGGMELNLRRDKFIYSLDFYQVNQLLFFKSPFKGFSQLGLLVGKYRDYKILRFQYQGGLSLLMGTEKKRKTIDPGGFKPLTYEYSKSRFTTVGLKSKVGFKIIPLPFLSIGMDLHANLNLKQSMFIPMISIGFGKLR